jgi:AraC-like DNA-binding protein
MANRDTGILGETIKYRFEQTDEVVWLKNFSGFLGNSNNSYYLRYPPSIANGFAKAGSTEDGLSHLLVNYTLNNDLLFEKKASNDFQISVYYYQFESTTPIEIEIDGQIIKNEQNTYDAIYVIGNTRNQSLRLKTGTKVKGLTININEEWINKNINTELFSKIKVLREGNFFLKLLTEKDRSLINALLQQNEEKLLLPRAYANNRLLRLLERVLLDVSKRSTNAGLPESINNTDFQSIMQIEKYLLSVYQDSFPSIITLARKACMSETKLKKLFKQSYGLGMYEYYQKNRMHKAKEMLLTSQKSIGEIGNTIGYQNLSNFSSAFRKEFNCLPKDIHLAD